MSSPTITEKENAHVDQTTDTHPTTSTSTVVEQGLLDLEKAADVQTAKSCSSVAERGEEHVDQTPEAHGDTAALFREPQIDKWRLVSLYIR
jgi:hypothetical protein